MCSVFCGLRNIRSHAEGYVTGRGEVGKTLCSIRAALKTAIKNKKKRIIYVIPYVSIIEQTAKVFEDIFGDVLPVLQHHSNYDFDDDNLQLVNQIDICATGNANIIIEYKSSTNKECFHNGVIKVFARENAKLNITVINLLNSNSEHFEAMENILEDNSDLNYTIIDIGGKNSIQNYYSNIIGKSAKNDLKTIYLGSENQIKDINYIAELRGQKSFVDIDVQGALKENAKKNFKGTIDFKKGCKKAKGNENEFCMLLSEKAKSLALPMLLCTEDDVEGNHSTASGKVDKEQLFYIMTRGLSYKEAVKLIVRANFNKTIERILDEEVKQNIIKEIDERLD